MRRLILLLVFIALVTIAVRRGPEAIVGWRSYLVLRKNAPRPWMVAE